MIGSRCPSFFLEAYTNFIKIVGEYAFLSLKKVGYGLLSPLESPAPLHRVHPWCRCWSINLCSDPGARLGKARPELVGETSLMKAVIGYASLHLMPTLPPSHFGCHQCMVYCNMSRGLSTKEEGFDKFRSADSIIPSPGPPNWNFYRQLHTPI